MKAKERLYNALPEEIKEMVRYVFGFDNEYLFRFELFQNMRVQDGIIIEAKYDDGYFNSISWCFTYNRGMEILVNKYSYSKELRFHYWDWVEPEDCNLTFKLLDSVRHKKVKIIEINNNSHDGINI